MEYLVRFVGQEGAEFVLALDHFPTLDDIPSWAVRVDIAIPMT